MGKIIALHNNKGGVGKTMLAFNLAGAAIEVGKQVLLVDLDEQGDITKLARGSPAGNSERTTRDLLLDDGCSVSDVAQRTMLEDLYVVPSGKQLKGIDTLLSLDPDALYRFKEKIKEARTRFGLIICDLPTPLGWTVRTAFSAADVVVIPIQLEMTAIVNATGVEKLVNSIQRHINNMLRLGGYIVNLAKPSAKHNEPVIQRQLFEFLRSRLGDKLYETVIYNYTIYQEARVVGRPITHYAPRSSQAQTIRELYKEVCRVREKVEA